LTKKSGKKLRQAVGPGIYALARAFAPHLPERTTPMRVKTYDTRCFDLAAMFLLEEPVALNTHANVHNLALEIQQLIEDEIGYLRGEAAKKQAKAK
jgi:hypothetical protein